MTTHTSTHAGESQCAQILAMLQERRGAWVSVLQLASLSGSLAVHSRITDLRKRGHAIEQQSHRSGRKIHSEYRLPLECGSTANR